MPYGPTSSPLPLQAPQLQFPGQYQGGGASAQRDAITQALMNIQNPQPRTQTPAGMGAAPQTPSPVQATDATMGAQPGAPGAMPGVVPGAGGVPGLMPGSMGQTMQPGGTMPAGVNFAQPPLLGQQPQQQPGMPPPPPAIGANPPQY